MRTSPDLEPGQAKLGNVSKRKKRSDRAAGTASVASPSPPSAAVRQEWFRRIGAEYGSAAQFHHLTLWLIQLGAPPEVLETGLRVVADELTHAELSAEVHADAGGEGAPQLVQEQLSLVRRPKLSLAEDVLLHAVDLSCLGETVAVRLFSRMREGAQVASAKRALDRILRDEVVHRDFGWTIAEWLLAGPDAGRLRKRLQANLPAMLEGVQRNYGDVGAPVADADGTFESADRRWGLIPRAEYVEAVSETIARDYAPRFAALDIEMPLS